MVSKEYLESLLIEARQLVSQYCVEHNCSECCVAYEVDVTGDELDFFVNDNRDGHRFKFKLDKETGIYTLKLNPCIHHSEKAGCSVHDKLNRPGICNDYPLFLEKTQDGFPRNYSHEYWIFVDELRCPAINRGNLERVFRKIEETGVHMYNSVSERFFVGLTTFL